MAAAETPAASTAPQTPPTLEGMASTFAPNPLHHSHSPITATPEDSARGRGEGYLPADAAALSRSDAVAHGVPAGVVRPDQYPLSASVWKRPPYPGCDSGEWVLEIEGTINDTYLTSRHTEPLSTRPEDVPGLPTLYAQVPDDAALAPDAEAGTVGDQGAIVHALAREYEHRDPDHTPTDAERAMMEDFGNELLDRIAASGAAPAGGLPGVETIAEALWAAENGGRTADTWAGLSVYGPGIRNKYLTRAAAIHARLTASGTGYPYGTDPSGWPARKPDCGTCGGTGSVDAAELPAGAISAHAHCPECNGPDHRADKRAHADRLRAAAGTGDAGRGVSSQGRQGLDIERMRELSRKSRVPRERIDLPDGGYIERPIAPTPPATPATAQADPVEMILAGSCDDQFAAASRIAGNIGYSLVAEQEADPAGEPVQIAYSNWRGEQTTPTILPTRIYWGANEWHPEPGWLIEALDVGKQALRTFEPGKIGAWGEVPATAPAQATPPIGLLRAAEIVARMAGEHQTGTAVQGLLRAAHRLRERDALAAPSADRGGATFQDRNRAWMDDIFAGDPTDIAERVHRFSEEALELGQSLGQTAAEAHQLVDYVFGRPIGEPRQEMGGTMTTLACLAETAALDMMACGEAELTRCNTPEVKAKIREKRSKRHGRGPLPGTYAPDFTPSASATEG